MRTEVIEAFVVDDRGDGLVVPTNELFEIYPKYEPKHTLVQKSLNCLLTP